MMQATHPPQISATAHPDWRHQISTKWTVWGLKLMGLALNSAYAETAPWMAVFVVRLEMLHCIKHLRDQTTEKPTTLFCSYTLFRHHREPWKQNRRNGAAK